MPAQKGIGRRVQLGVAKETTRGTAPGSPSYYLFWNELGIQEKFENVTDVEAQGIIEDSQAETRVRDWAEGPIKLPVTDKSFPLFLLSLLGTDTPALHSGESVVYDHVMTVLQNAQHQSLSLYIHDPLAAVDYVHKNSLVKKISLDLILKEYIKATIELIGLKGASIGTLSPAQVAENRFVPQYVTFKQASTVAGLAGATPLQVKSLKLEIDQNIESDDVLGQTAPRDFLTKEFKVEGTVEVIFQNESDFKTNSLANTTQAMLVDIKNTDVILGTATNPELKIELAKVHFKEFTVARTLHNLVYQTVKFKAVYSASDSEMIKITATNTLASY